VVEWEVIVLKSLEGFKKNQRKEKIKENKKLQFFCSFQFFFKKTEITCADG
jgi:hypothetical protein